MQLIVGLGNPGRDYANNRHNIGFLAVDRIAARYSFPPPRSRYQGLIQEGAIDGAKVILLKPMTYMNESGRAVGEAVRFYKMALDQVTVIYDEIDLVAGKVRVKRGGGSAGHNGIRSIDAHIGKDYRRVRLGVGHPGGKGAVHKHVLSDFAKADAGWVDDLIDAVAAATPTLLAGEESEFMNQIAVATKPQQPATPKTGNTDRPKSPRPEPTAQSDAQPAPSQAAPEPRRETALGRALASALGRKRDKD